MQGIVSVDRWCSSLLSSKQAGGHHSDAHVCEIKTRAPECKCLKLAIHVQPQSAHLSEPETKRY